MLLGRDLERGVLARLLAGVRSGGGRALVVGGSRAQRGALRTAFGLDAGSPPVGSSPDRFLVGLAVLGLLAEVAQEC